MTNYSVMVKRDPRSYQAVRYDVSREGNNIKCTDTSANGFRHMGDNFNITMQADSVQIRSREKNFDIQMSPDGVSVSTPQEPGLRRSGIGDVPVTGFIGSLQPEQYEQVGLSVASSLIGIPLVFPQAV